MIRVIIFSVLEKRFVFWTSLEVGWVSTLNKSALGWAAFVFGTGIRKVIFSVLNAAENIITEV